MSLLTTFQFEEASREGSHGVPAGGRYLTGETARLFISEFSFDSWRNAPPRRLATFSQENLYRDVCTYKRFENKKLNCLLHASKKQPIKNARNCFSCLPFALVNLLFLLCHQPKFCHQGINRLISSNIKMRCLQNRIFSLIHCMLLLTVGKGIISN